MTAAEMKAEFLALYDAATSLAAPGWEDSEISNFLNISQLEIIRDLALNKAYDLISNIIIDSSALVVVADTLIKNSYTYDLTSGLSGYLYYVSSQVAYTRTNPTVSTAETIYTDLIDYRQAAQFVTTSFNKPYFRTPKAFVANKKLRIIVDYYTTIATGSAVPLVITYVQTPTSISISGVTTSNVNDALHKEIVKKAVELAVESVKRTKIANQ